MILLRIKKTILILLALLAAALPDESSAAQASRKIDDDNRVMLKGNVHQFARSEFDEGPVQTTLPMERMILALRPSPVKQASLEKFLDELNDPASSNFHRWLTPKEFGEQFGPDHQDVDAAAEWIRSHGFTIDHIATSGMWIDFSGTAADVERVFRAQIRNYRVEGKLHHANATDPEIPRGLADLVAGIVSLHNFPRKTMNSGAIPLVQAKTTPDYTSGSTHYLSPTDFSTIYNTSALYAAGIDGTGQNIAIVGRTNPSPTNWSTFRSLMGLPSVLPQVIVNGPDPGDLGGGEDNEADLDVEWSGAVAKNASIIFVTSKSTGATDGVDLSAQYIVNNNLAPVMSTSFGSCESGMGTAENAFYNSLWQQAAAQGITSFVSSGDAGAAGCNVGSDASGSGKAVNGLSSTPYNVAVGGTQFNEGAGAYWNSSNGTVYDSAMSYIPETTWNESGTVAGGSGLWATGGGASSKYSKQSWQVAPGVPADKKRDVPDVSLSSAMHDAYLVQSQGGLYTIGGTSATSPSFAGLMALIVQKTGQRQGNANPRFYQLGNAQYGSTGANVFHDVTTGNNSVPGVTGYSSSAGYDRATGLGSVDAYALVANWVPDISLAVAPTSFAISQGATGTAAVVVTTLGNLNSGISFTVSGLPLGVAATLTPTTIVAPGSGSSVMTITVGSSAVAGTYPLMVTGVSGTITHSSAVNLTIIPVFTVSSLTTNTGGTITPAIATVAAGSSVTLTISPDTGYNISLLTDNGVNVAASAAGSNTYTYMISNITGDHAIQATFSAVGAAVSVPAMGSQGLFAAMLALAGIVLLKRRKTQS
jgi:pseudomonalisin